MMNKKQTNEFVNNLISTGQYNKAWQYVKNIGILEVPNIKERYIIFNRIAFQYDNTKNKSFMAYYKKCLKRAKFEDNGILTDNKKITRILINRQISPELDKKRRPVVEELENWEEF